MSPRYINCYFNDDELFLMMSALAALDTEEANTLRKILDVLRSKLKVTVAENLVVHRLRAGMAICGFCYGVVPAHWPAGHKWTADKEQSTCPACKAEP